MNITTEVALACMLSNKPKHCSVTLSEFTDYCIEVSTKTGDIVTCSDGEFFGAAVRFPHLFDCKDYEVCRKFDFNPLSFLTGYKEEMIAELIQVAGGTNLPRLSDLKSEKRGMDDLGRVAVPKGMREQLGWEAGDRFEVSVCGEGVLLSKTDKP